MAKRVSKAVDAVPAVQPRILVIRGQRVILDRDLADVHGVPTKRLNEQVRRQRDRFPEDFMFQLTEAEAANLKSQIATSSSGWGGRRKLPCAFTEHGAVMAASMLQTPTAVRASIFVVRAFIRLREMLASNAELARKLAELEQRMVGHDRQFVVVFDAIRKLMEPPPARNASRRWVSEQAHLGHLADGQRLPEPIGRRRDGCPRTSVRRQRARRRPAM